MKTSALRFHPALFLAVVLPFIAQVTPSHAAPVPEEGIALAIVYDTSGSMLEKVQDGAGRMTPKFEIANRALVSIIDRLEALSRSPDGPRRIESGLFVFRSDAAHEAVPFGSFNPAAQREWMKTFRRPEGATPLGEAVRSAGRAVLNSKLSRKHVLVLTDGMNTRGTEPGAVMTKLNQEADRGGSVLSVHFVAFDVDAKVFAPLKRIGATVVGAVDEAQLNSQLEFILEEKILLEAETPPAAKQPKKN